jgi:hypothetical protein
MDRLTASNIYQLNLDTNTISLRYDMPYNYRYVFASENSELIKSSIGHFVIVSTLPSGAQDKTVFNKQLAPTEQLELSWRSEFAESKEVKLHYEVYLEAQDIKGKDKLAELVYSGNEERCRIARLFANTGYDWYVVTTIENDTNVSDDEVFSDVYRFATGAAVEKAHNVPNPFDKRKGTMIKWGGGEGYGWANVKIYSEYGDLCYETTTDKTYIDYNGRDTQGKEMYNDTYIVVITKHYNNGNDKTETFRMMIVK